jgi:metal-responsive CopG/Arc/MetJ family transcriptional regulator
MKNGNTQYGQVSVPKALLSEVDTAIEKNPQLGFRSRSEAVLSAIRDWLEKVNRK